MVGIYDLVNGEDVPALVFFWEPENLAAIQKKPHVQVLQLLRNVQPAHEDSVAGGVGIVVDPEVPFFGRASLKSPHVVGNDGIICNSRHIDKV